MKKSTILLLMATIVTIGVMLLSRSHLEIFTKHNPRTITRHEHQSTTTRVRRIWPAKLASELSFVPLQLTKCDDLFTSTTVLPAEITDAIKKLDATLKNITLHMPEGYAMQFREKPIAHDRLVKMPFISTVCETGFNAGHGTLTWLVGNPNVTVYSFDIGFHRHSRPMAEYISKLFPGRHVITWGDSAKTLPTFHKENPQVECDLISIDGGHDYDIALQDFDNFRQMATCNNILIFDDYPKRVALAPLWEGKKRSGEVTEFFKCAYDNHPFGFSVGRYLLDKCVH